MTFFLGTRPYDFTNDAGERIVGVSVWLGDDEMDGATGIFPFKTSMRPSEYERVFSGFDVETTMQPVNTMFDHRGKLVKLTVAKN